MKVQLPISVSAATLLMTNVGNGVGNVGKLNSVEVCDTQVCINKYA